MNGWVDDGRWMDDMMDMSLSLHVFYSFFKGKISHQLSGGGP